MLVVVVPARVPLLLDELFDVLLAVLRRGQGADAGQ